MNLNSSLLFSFTALLITFFMTSGCATIMHGSTQDISISSVPTNASVTINGNSRGETPLLISLNRKENHSVSIHLDGYEKYETYLTRSTSGWIFGNIIFGGLIGLVVDAATGSIYKLSPETISTQLKEDRRIAEKSGGEFFIAIVMEPDPEWEKIGSLVRK